MSYLLEWWLTIITLVFILILRKRGKCDLFIFRWDGKTGQRYHKVLLFCCMWILGGERGLVWRGAVCVSAPDFCFPKTKSKVNQKIFFLNSTSLSSLFCLSFFLYFIPPQTQEHFSVAVKVIHAHCSFWRRYSDQISCSLESRLLTFVTKKKDHFTCNFGEHCAGSIQEMDNACKLWQDGVCFASTLVWEIIVQPPFKGARLRSSGALTATSCFVLSQVASACLTLPVTDLQAVC